MTETDTKTQTSPQDQSDDFEIIDMDWSVPQGLSGDALEKCNELVDSLCELIASKLKILLVSEVTLAHDDVKPLFGSSVKTLAEDGKHYITPLLNDRDEIGAILIDTTQAMLWVRKLLGGGLTIASSDETKDLTDLESDLLLDCIDVILKAVNEVLPLPNKSAMTRGANTSKTHTPAVDETGEFSYIRITDPESGSNVMSILIPGAVIDQLLGGEENASAADDNGNSAKWMQEHLYKSDIQISAQLGALSTQTRSIVSIEPGDILLLDGQLGQPIKINVQGIGLFMGKIIQNHKRYALQVTSLQPRAGRILK